MIALGTDDEKTAFTEALRAEQAAIFGYGLVTAFANPTRRAAIEEADAAHRARLGSVVDALEASGARPPRPPAGYVGEVGDNPVAAARLAATLEADCALAWRAAVVAATSAEVRRFAGDALTHAHRMTLRWSLTFGGAADLPALPG